jgi:thiamine-phosphate pyrophosphorylase
MPSGLFLALCDRVVRAAEPYAARIIVNDRVDLARLAGAAGAHVGQDDLAPSEARAVLGPDAILGFSTHTPAQIEAATREPITYVAIGPVFGTKTKATGYDAVGVSMVTEAARLARGLPVVAIGGITLETAPRVIEAGATSIAVISDLLVGDSPATRARQYIDAMKRGV